MHAAATSSRSASQITRITLLVMIIVPHGEMSQRVQLAMSNRGSLSFDEAIINGVLTTIPTGLSCVWRFGCCLPVCLWLRDGQFYFASIAGRSLKLAIPAKATA